MPLKKKLENHKAATKSYIHTLCELIGDNPSREGLTKTPNRVSELKDFLYSGYNTNLEEVLDSVFSDGACNEMVIIKNIEFYSMCEHHLLPFFGTISVGYIPNKQVVGISNIAKLVETFARRLQIQENMTTQIADSMMNFLKPKGVMVVCEALHLCMAMRGVSKQNATIITSAVRGLFQKDSRTRTEFMQLVNRQQ